LSQRASVQVKICNRLGLHARPATTFAQLATTFKSAITIRHEDEEVDGKSVMQILMLGATQGSPLEITAQGPDAKDALDELTELVKAGFGEE